MAEDTQLPEQPSVEEIAQFPQAPEAPVFVEDNAKNEEKTNLATLSGKDVDPAGDGEVHVK